MKANYVKKMANSPSSLNVLYYTAKKLEYLVKYLGIYWTDFYNLYTM